MSARHRSAAAEDDPPAFQIVSGDPDAAEVAAISAILAATAIGSADAAPEPPEPTPSAWQRSQRSLREPLHPGAGSWRGFSG